MFDAQNMEGGRTVLVRPPRFCFRHIRKGSLYGFLPAFGGEKARNIGGKMAGT